MTDDPRVTSLRRGGLVFDVHDDGPLDGEPVVLLHGFPEDSSSWSRVVPLLHDAGLRTVALDQRGYSPGARPLARGAYRLDFLVQDVLALLDRTGPAHVVGHDWGGVVSWALAAWAPARVRSLTVLSTPHPGALSRSLVRSNQGLRSLYVAVLQLPALPEALLGRALPSLLRRSGVPGEDADRYAARMRDPGALRAALHWYRALPLSRTPVADVTVPTTYVWGARDPALGRRAAEDTERFVRAPYRFVELDAGHWLPEVAVDDVAGAVTDRVATA
ncbi:alpha/beta fold hydrolase [Cellulosimicrobium sp. CUA-896]|uniref:alpha/beta fold hydrolase n=1 Tax=Cellulosimicrobium sp. CUA-896 TaxID=1517881 RepID=UPI0009680783|nr:alpha/beta fold hydrolase [Cellulosimicrobium sp. CUA-896]OLT52418.1 alpha/beta hydrolase [Cellulosimicrobium sp. CUA-896]